MVIQGLVTRKQFRARWILIVSVLLVLMVQSYTKAARAGGNDFTCYYLSARAFLDGKGPWFFLSIASLFLFLLLYRGMYRGKDRGLEAVPLSSKTA